jgi:hypothetical protein
MVVRVKAIATERGQIYPADERDLAVDDDELLVVTMHRALVKIERALHACAAYELLAHAAHGRARWREDRQWRPSPQQHPYFDALGQLTKQIAQAGRSLFARQPEIGRDVPSGDMHMRASARERLGDARQRHPPVNQDVERTVCSRGRVASRPQSSVGRGIELIDPANAPKTAAMMGTDRGLDAFAHQAVHSLNQGSGHQQSLGQQPKQASMLLLSQLASGEDSPRERNDRQRHPNERKGAEQ